ncbi:hypothetical protein ACHMW5_36050 (plasmid) [Azospirillum melinis]|uniref:hypothetical protein n=1 Tax=Azospirillum melinis TaxID=328839 RepID=UPI003756A01C
MLPGLDKQAVADASYELEALGLLRMQRFLGGNWHANLTPFFYEQVDPQLMGWNTAADAMEVARIMLAEDTGNASTLHAKTGWTKRRFNPAFRALLHLFPNGRVRKVIQPDYPTAGVVLAPEDKAALRRFVARGSGG